MTVFTIANFKTHSTREITAKFPSRDKMEHARYLPTSMEMCMDDHLTLITEKTATTAVPSQSLRAKLLHTQLTEEHCFQPCRILTRHGKYTNFPRKTVPAKKREICGYRYIYIRDHDSDQLSEQVFCTQCTHTSGYRLQAREISSELPMTEDGKFQHGGISTLQCQC